MDSSSSKLTVYYAGYNQVSSALYFEALRNYGIRSIIDCRCSPNSRTEPEYKLKCLKEKSEENNMKYYWKGKDFGGKHQIKKLIQTLSNNEARIAEDFLCCVFSTVPQPSLIMCKCPNIMDCHCRYIADALMLYNLADIYTITFADGTIIKQQYHISQPTKIKIVGYIPKTHINNIQQPRVNWSKYLKSMEQQDVNAVLRQFADKWKKEQLQLKHKLIVHNEFDFYLPHEKEQKFDMEDIFRVDKVQKTKLKYIAGVDISHGADDEDVACAGLVVLEYPSLKQVYEKFNIVRYNQPYIAGFLAFREVDFLVTIIDEIRADSPEFVPQLILVDGNGVLHHRGFGLASHLGVLCNIPTIGVAKNILVVDGLDKNEVKAECERKLLQRGDMVQLVGKSKGLLGVALRCSKKGKTPVYVSSGHRISLKSAVEIVLECAPSFKQPEPIRCVDSGSRRAISAYEKKLREGQQSNS